MPILRLLPPSEYGPDEIEIMKRAYEEALKICGVADRTSAAAELLAFRVIALFKAGERDLQLIARRASDRRGPA